jgi:glyoxylase-like metal-dependent hydrolase (beta-lactamase superfamily II)
MMLSMGYTELCQLGENTWVLPGAVNIGVYRVGGRAVLIDSGNDKDAGRQVNKLLQSIPLEPELIINTHSNADHIGGNAYFQRKYGCTIAATGIEAAFIESPVLESAFLFGGYPFPALRNKFLEAPPSKVTDIIPSRGSILDTPLQAIPLAGHFFDMIGVKTPDDVVFIADSLFSEAIIEKYHIFYIYDVGGYLETLEMLTVLQASGEARLFVPSHAEPAENISALIDLNRKKIGKICDDVTEACGERAGFDRVLERICSRYAIDLDPNQYVLISSTIRCYLAYLTGESRIEPVLDGGSMHWRKV